MGGVVELHHSSRQVLDILPSNNLVQDTLPSNNLVQDILPNLNRVWDTRPSLSQAKDIHRWEDMEELPLARVIRQELQQLMEVSLQHRAMEEEHHIQEGSRPVRAMEGRVILE